MPITYVFSVLVSFHSIYVPFPCWFYLSIYVTSPYMSSLYVCLLSILIRYKIISFLRIYILFLNIYPFINTSFLCVFFLFIFITHMSFLLVDPYFEYIFFLWLFFICRCFFSIYNFHLNAFFYICFFSHISLFLR